MTVIEPFCASIADQGKAFLEVMVRFRGGAEC